VSKFTVLLSAGTQNDGMEQMLNETTPTTGTVISLPASHFDSPPYAFSPSQFARLRIYRAAVIARFYTDQCQSSSY
jgi:hypothetical protein